MTVKQTRFKRFKGWLLSSLISYKGFNDVIFFEKFHFKMSNIKNGEYYRFLTSGFLHVDKLDQLFQHIGHLYDEMELFFF